MLTISVVFSTVHEVGREQGVLTTSVVSVMYTRSEESKEYLLSVLFSVLYTRSGESKEYQLSEARAISVETRLYMTCIHHIGREVRETINSLQQ